MARIFLPPPPSSIDLNGPNMSASQVNANVWSFLSPELVYQLTVATRIVAGALAVSSSLFRQRFLPAYVVSDGG